MSLVRCLPTLIATLAVLVAPLAAADSALNTPPEGFTALFNGTDLSGWRGLVTIKDRLTKSPEEVAKLQEAADKSMHEHWKVIDGTLVFDGKGQSLCSAKDFGNFELLVDWKIEKGGDSGIYLRGCPQVQIWDTEWEDYFKHGAEKGSGSLWNNKNNPRFPDAKADKPVGEWNNFHIKMVGDKVTVKLNGKTVVDNVTMENLWEPSKPIYAKGPIELQNHGNTLYFRNIYVKELAAE
jgi:hypothetical protein